MFVIDIKMRGADIGYGQAGSRVGPDWVSFAPQPALKDIWKGAT